MSWIIDGAQLLASGAVLATLPVLVIAHGAFKRVPWALPAASALHAAAWALLIWLAAPAIGLTLGPSDLIAGAALLVASWLGWFQISSVLRRGFSLQMMVELERGAQSRQELESAYADGRGLGWLMKKRLAGLAGTGLIKRDDDLLALTPRGRLTARLSRIYKSLFGIGAGG